MSSNWNAFLDRRIEAGPLLTQEEHRLLDVLMRSILGWNRTEESIGETLLRQASRLHGRSFSRARDGLIAKSLVEYTPPAARGRGHRGHYRLILGAAVHPDDHHGTPAQTRDIRDNGRPADPRALSLEAPAQTPAQYPAPVRGRMEEGVEKDDDALIDELLQGFGTALKDQRRLFAQARASSQHGFLACVEKARDGRNPIALLTSLIQAGEHLSIAAEEEPKVNRLDRWLRNTAPLLDEHAVSVVLTDSFHLSGDEHTAAMQMASGVRAARNGEAT